MYNPRDWVDYTYIYIVVKYVYKCIMINEGQIRKIRCELFQ